MQFCKSRRAIWNEPFLRGTVGAMFLPPRTQRETRASPPKFEPNTAACVWQMAEEMLAIEAPLQSSVLMLAK